MVPSTGRTHTNHEYMSYTELMLGSSKLSSKKNEDRRIMSYATNSSSGVAGGMYKMHREQSTKQAMANAGKKDKIDSHSSVDKSILRGINDADGVRDLLHHHGCKVLILKLTKGKDKDEGITYDVSDGIINNSGGDIDYGKDDVSKWVKDTKSGLSTHHKDLICIAWTSNDMMRLANAFPQSLSIDLTHKAVKIDGLSLLTATVKDSFGRTTVILRLWVPNQKAWMFKYVLLVVIPQLLGKEFCLRVRVIVTDGDSVLINMVELAIATVYVNARRLPCCWHLIDRPMQKVFRPRFVTKRGVSVYFVEWFCRFLKRWLFTWMRPSGGIYTREEYQVSKAVLLAFLDSKALESKFLPSAIGAIKEYVLGVLRYEHEYLACDSMDAFGFEVYTNCAHEGTNSGAKYNSDGVKATSSLGTSSNNLGNYDRQIFTERSLKCSHEYRKDKIWSKKWNHLTTRAAEIISDQEDKTKLVLTSSWVPEELSFYVVCPNDILRHSRLAEDKIRKKAEVLKNKLDEVPKDSRAGPPNRKRKVIKTNNAGDPTKKELSKMSLFELILNMTESEKESADRDNSTRCLCIPEFTSAFKVELKLCDDGHWYLCCPCMFGKRFGAPCVHEFFIYQKFLKGIGVREWGYRDVSIAHWAIYSYLYARSEAEMSSMEKDQFQKLKRMDPSKRFGTKCDILEGASISINWVNLLCSECHTAECNKDPTDSLSAEEWRKLPAAGRVTNYSREEVDKCLSGKNNMAASTLNSSQYEMSLSQQAGDDGWQDFGIPFNDTNDPRDDLNFQQMLDNTSTQDNVSRESRRADLLKDFYAILSTTNLNDSLLYEGIKKSLANINTDARRYNEALGGIPGIEDDGKIYFPNSSFGDNGRDKITNSDKRC